MSGLIDTSWADYLNMNSQTTLKNGLFSLLATIFENNDYKANRS